MGRGLGWGSGPAEGCGPVTQHSTGGWEEGGGFTSRATGSPTPTPAVPQVLMCPSELAAKNQEQTARTFTRRGRHGPLLRKCPQLPGWPSGRLAAHLSHVGPWAFPTCLPGKSRWRSPPRRLNRGELRGGLLWAARARPLSAAALRGTLSLACWARSWPVLGGASMSPGSPRGQRARAQPGSLQPWPSRPCHLPCPVSLLPAWAAAWWPICPAARSGQLVWAAHLCQHWPEPPELHCACPGHLTRGMLGL